LKNEFVRSDYLKIIKLTNMKKHIMILAACFLFCGVLSSYAQFDKLKPGNVPNVGKPKPKSTKPEEDKKTNTETNNKEQTTTNGKEQTGTTKPATTVDFRIRSTKNGVELHF